MQDVSIKSVGVRSIAKDHLLKYMCPFHPPHAVVVVYRSHPYLCLRRQPEQIEEDISKSFVEFAPI